MDANIQNQKLLEGLKNMSKTAGKLPNIAQNLESEIRKIIGSKFGSFKIESVKQATLNGKKVEVGLMDNGIISIQFLEDSNAGKQFYESLNA